MIIEQFLEKVKHHPVEVEFQETIAIIDEYFHFTPTTFKNGNTINEAGQNNGSCKLFAFAQKHSLSQNETLVLFGAYYREDVLNHPDGTDHQNIRNFQQFSWEGIVFDNNPLTLK